jgi:phospholipase A1/A2
MKKILFFILFLIIPSGIFAEKIFVDPVQLYRSNYFITGDPVDDQVKFQLSVMYPLLWPFDSGLYFGYTQLSAWDIYDNSSPFAETNYQPEFFYRLESGGNLFNDVNLGPIDYIQISPIYHRSNGQGAQALNRSENKYYAEIQMSAGKINNFGVRGKIFDYYNVSSQNENINDYHKNYEAAVFYRSLSKSVANLEQETITCSWGGNPFDKGWIQGEISARILTSYIQPKIFLQWFYGYDEFMVSYYQKNNALRIGIGL